MRKIIYTRPDGGLCVVHPVRNTHPKRETLSDEEIEERAWKKLPEDAINPRFVEAGAIPSDRTFRNAWVQNGGAVEHDMAKAREIHKDRLRAERAPLLAALDVEYQRADERGDAAAKTAVASRKQALRDVTADPAIEAAKTPEQLNAVRPAALRSS